MKENPCSIGLEFEASVWNHDLKQREEICIQLINDWLPKEPTGNDILVEINASKVWTLASKYHSPPKETGLWRISWSGLQEKGSFKTNADPSEGSWVKEISTGQIGTVWKRVMDYNIRNKKRYSKFMVIFFKKWHENAFLNRRMWANKCRRNNRTSKITIL